MPKESGLESYIIRKVDRARVQSMLGQERAVQTITDRAEIEKIFIQAKGVFNHFIYTKTSNSNKANICFNISFDAMIDTLGLSRIPGEIAQSKMDEIVLSAPGIIKTDIGYTVSDRDLLYENFGPGAIRRKIIDFLSKDLNPDRFYTCKEVAQALNLTPTIILKLVRKLIEEDIIIIMEKASVLGRGKGKSTTRFKIAK